MKTHDPLALKQGPSSIQRPRFSPGLLLEDDDLNAGVDYTRGLMRLVLRSLFGCGVVCGLKIAAVWQCNDTQLLVNIGPGLAFDCMGNAINVPTAQALTLDIDCEPIPPYVWVVLCYKEKCCRPRDVSCTDDESSQPTYTRITDSFEVGLYERLPKCACTCAPPAQQSPSATDSCCDPPATTAGGVPQAGTTATKTDDDKLGICACYVHHYCGDCECDCDCNCVVIGKVVLRTQEQGKYTDKLLAPPVNDHEVVREVRPVLNGFLRHGCDKVLAKMGKDNKEKQHAKK